MRYMSADTILAFVNALTVAVLAVLGISLSRKRWLQILIGSVAVAGIILTTVQAWRAHDGQVQL